MKNNKKLNENVTVNMLGLTKRYPVLSNKLDTIAESLHAVPNVNVRQKDVMMVVEGMNRGNIANFIIDELKHAKVTNVKKSDILPYMKASLNRVNERFDEYEFADYDDVDAWDDETEYDAWDDYEEVSDDEPFDDDLFDSVEAPEFDDDETLNDEASFEDQVFDECDKFIEECGNCEDCDEDMEFDECLHESVKNKKKGCCPPVKGRTLVNLHEGLKSLKMKNIRNTMEINESIYQSAMKKAKMSNKDIALKHSALKHVKEQIGTTKYNDIIKALKEGRTSFYTKKSINGKNIKEYSDKELYSLFKEVKEQIKAIKKANKLNESVDTDKLAAKKRLLTILDEELTYRLTARKYLNEDEEVKDNDATESSETSEDTTEDATEGTTEDATEDPEKDEEVELARVIITVANQEAADDLKSELVSAGIPDDAIEFETDSDDEVDDESSDEEGDNADTEESDEESTDDETNESLHVNTFRRLLEDDESTPDTEGAEAESTEGEETDGEGDSEGEADDVPVKVVLTNTDYIEMLAQVLNDVYGVSQDEFEEMIGGSIVSDDSEEDSDDKESEEKDNDSEQEEKSSNGDAAVDNMSDEDLAALFGESANK